MEDPQIDPGADGEETLPPVLQPSTDPLWDDWTVPPRVPEIPVLHLHGFDGPMDLLLDLAERQRVDFGHMSILALAEQFVAALQLLSDRVSIERRADWVVLAARLVLLRSRLLFPENAAAAVAAERAAATELRRIDDLVDLRVASAWLEARPVLGQDVFARGQPELLGVGLETAYAIDVIGFLWASLALFEDALGDLTTTALYRPYWLDLYSMPEARERILRQLADHPDGLLLDQLLPQGDGATVDPDLSPLRRRSAWASAFAAGLEMAKQGDVTLAQEAVFTSIHFRSKLAATSLATLGLS